jgi:hypothetical protein
METKPWLNAPVRNRFWGRSSNHCGNKVEPCKVDGVVLIQDGNMGGTYVRVIQWCPEIDDQRRFGTYTPGNPESSHDDWYFTQSISEMNVNDVIKNQDGTFFKVVKNVDNTYVKVLERVLK